MTPLEKIKDGIIKFDLQLVADGYFDLTGEKIDVPNIDYNKQDLLKSAINMVNAGYVYIYGRDCDSKEAIEKNEEDIVVKENEEDRQAEKSKVKKKRGRPRKKKSGTESKKDKTKSVIKKEEDVESFDDEIGFEEQTMEIDSVFSKGEKRKIRFIGTEENEELKKEAEAIRASSKKQKRGAYVEPVCNSCGKIPAYPCASSSNSGVKRVMLCNDCASKDIPNRKSK